MIGGAFGRVEVRRSLEEGLMAETTADEALVVSVLQIFFFFWVHFLFQSYESQGFTFLFIYLFIYNFINECLCW